jgi:hypothetical protein
MNVCTVSTAKNATAREVSARATAVRCPFREPPVVPPSFFFGIWGVITVGCAAAAVWGLLVTLVAGVLVRRHHPSLIA